MQPVRNKDIWASSLLSVLTIAASHLYAGMKTEGPYVDISKSASALEKALAAGTVVYKLGRFTGKFTAAISKELKDMGATFQSTFAGWSIPITHVPQGISHLAYRVDENKGKWFGRFEEAMKHSGYAALAGSAIAKIHHDLSIKVRDEVNKTTDSNVTMISSEVPYTFTMNLDEALRKFTSEEKRAIRAIIRQATAENWSTPQIEDALAGRLEIGHEKIKFMAKQSMAIAATNIKAKIYQQAGFPRYRWETKKDGAVRSDHALLDGGIFEWASPPLVNSATGMHAHPGQDWNCRCVAIPVEE